MAVESYQKLMGDLKKLRLPAMTEMLDSYVKQAASSSMSYMDFLSGLVSEEVRYKEQRTVHELDCVLKSVIKNKIGQEVEFKREDAIKNGFEYHFNIYSNGRMIVNGTDVYIKDADTNRSYSLQGHTKINPNMKFQFNEKFDDVIFLIIDEEIEYHYVCTP